MSASQNVAIALCRAILMSRFGSSGGLYVWHPLSVLAVVCMAVGGLAASAAEDGPAAWKPHNVVYSAEVGKKGELLRVQVVIDGRRHSAIVDTGAGKSLVSSRFARPGAIEPWSVNVLSHGGLTRLPIQRVSEFKLGRVNCDWITNIAVADLESLREQTGVEIEAIVGMDVLERFISHFDFDSGTFLLCSENPKPAPPGEAVAYLKLGMCPAIGGDVGTGQPIRFVLDTGACGSVALTEMNLEAVKQLAKPQGTGVVGTAVGLDGKSIASEQLRLSRFALTSYDHSGLVAHVSANNSIGRRFLCRYRVTIDPFSKSVYFAPSRRHLLRDDGDFCGLTTVVDSQDTVRRVTCIAPRSVAEQAGFRCGDIITALDGLDGPVSTNCEWNWNLTLPKDRDIRCFVRRGTAELTLVLPSGKP